MPLANGDPGNQVRVLSAVPTASLPPRQAEVLTLHAIGLSDAEIAGLLVIARSVVRTHLAHAAAAVVPC